MVNIFFVNTSYQLSVALDVYMFEGVKDATFFVPEKVYFDLVKYKSNFSGIKVKVLYGVNDKKGKFEIRTWAKSFFPLINEFKDKKIRLWLANDDHIFAQLIISKLNVTDFRLFEDGLGSYISRHSILADNSNLKAIYRRLLKLIFLFPYYKALKRFGGNVKASKCYAYNKYCFPSQSKAKKIVLDKRFYEKTVRGFRSESVVVVGQPLVEMGLISTEEYFKVLEATINDHFSGKRVVYKAHHRESIWEKVPSEFLLSVDEVSLEDRIYNTDGSLIVVGFFSTVLLNSVRLDSVKEVIAIKPLNSTVDVRNYDILRKSGCTIVEL